jgi:hypothetical protein
MSKELVPNVFALPANWIMPPLPVVAVREMIELVPAAALT